MNRKHVLLAGGAVTVIVAVTLAVLLATPRTYDSTTESLLRNLHQTLLAVAIPLGILVEAALFYAALKFHGNDDPKPTKENRRLEITWTVGVAVVLVFVAASSYVVLADPMVTTAPDATPDEDDVVIDVTGQNWYWSFSYPEENVTTKNELVLPVNRTVFLRVTSRDVIHSVYVPALGIKQDAVPGQTNAYRTRPTDTGTYRLYCAEYCGAGHSKMIATVTVVSQDEYRASLRQQSQEDGSGNNSSGTAPGERRPRRSAGPRGVDSA